MNSFKHYLLILAISSLPLISIFATADLPHTHDGPVHLARMAAYYKSLSDGQILPRWAGDLNYGYGMPLFNFIYPLSYLISAIFITFNFGLVTSFKITLALSYLLSGVFILAWAKTFFRDDQKAILVTIFYQFVPFRLIELLVRGSFAEAYVYTLFPLVLWGLTKISSRPNYLYFVATALAGALLIIAHNSLSLVFFGMACLFVMYFSKNKEKLLYGFSALTVSLMLSAFYWIPAIWEHKYTYGDLFMREMYRSHFPPLVNLLLPNFTSLPQLQTGGIAVQIGLFHVLGAFLTLVVLRYKSVDRQTKKIWLYALTIVALSLFFMQPVSIFFWEKISWLRQFQFPWRLLGPVGLATSLLSLSFLSYSWFRKTVPFLALLVLVIVSTGFYWRPPLGFDKVKDESIYWDYPLNTTYFGETDVIWSAGPAKQYPRVRVEVIDGKAEVSNFNKKTTLHTFLVNAQSPARLVDHTQYFPGWKVLVDNVKTPIEFQDPNWRGLITFFVPAGKHQIKVVFAQTKIRYLANLISVSTLVLLLIGTFLLRLSKKYGKN